MRKILGFFLAISIISCQDQNTGENITGTVEGAKDGTKIIVSTLDDNSRPQAIDTAVVANENFSFDLPSTDVPTFNILTVTGSRGNALFIYDNEPVQLELHKDSLHTSVVTGGEHNKVLQEYFSRIKDFRGKMNNLTNQYQNPALNSVSKKQEFQKKAEIIQKEYTDYLVNMATDNPNSLVAVMAITDLQNMKSVSVPELREMYNNLEPETKNSPMAKTIDQQLKIASVTAIGSKAPNFSGPTPSGETLDMQDALGKITLVDFWASWCKPCRVENPNIVRVYKKYHDKGLNVIGVSLDKSKEKWLAAIDADNLTWNHISHLEFWQDPIAQSYNVRSIPAAFLLDENGVIIGKGNELRGQALEDKVAELLDGE